MRGKEDGEIRALLGEKLKPMSGESEGGEGRLVTLKEPIGIDILEKRVKSHLKLSQSLLLSSFYPFTPSRLLSPNSFSTFCHS